MLGAVLALTACTNDATGGGDDTTSGRRVERGGLAFVLPAGAPAETPTSEVDPAPRDAVVVGAWVSVDAALSAPSVLQLQRQTDLADDEAVAAYLDDLMADLELMPVTGAAQAQPIRVAGADAARLLVARVELPGGVDLQRRSVVMARGDVVHELRWTQSAAEDSEAANASFVASIEVG